MNLLGVANAEEPPSPALATAPGLPIEIDFHQTEGGGVHLEPVLAYIPFEKLRKTMPVTYTLITPLPKGFDSSWRYYSMMKRFNVDDVSKLPPFMAIGSKEREIPEIIKPQPADIVIEKHTASIFIGTHFEYMMRNRGITTVIFTGIATEIGIESSARDASNRGFYPVIVSDCVSSADQAAHERSLETLVKVLIVEKSANII